MHASLTARSLQHQQWSSSLQLLTRTSRLRFLRCIFGNEDDIWFRRPPRTPANNTRQKVLSPAKRQQKYMIRTGITAAPAGAATASGAATAGEKKRKRTAMTGAKYYGVQTGRTPGVYETWQNCLAEVKGFKNAKFKSFATREEAEQFVAGYDPSQDPNSSSFVQKYYGVRSGKVPGVYTDWPTAKAQVVGVVKPKVRVFLTRAEAEEFVCSGSETASTLATAPTTRSAGSSVSQPSRDPVSSTSERAPKKSRTESSTPSASVSPPIRTQQFAPSQSSSRSSSESSSPALAAALASAVPPTDSTPKSVSSVLRIYTDGSALSNGRANSRAGIGVYFGESDSRNISEPLAGPRQTNQRAELTAILRAITAAPLHRPVLIFTDSQYAIKCVTVWHQAWERNNWKNSAGKSVENRDLVESILAKVREREVEGRRRGAGMGKGGWTRFEWVKGHTGADDGNSKADMLAVAGARLGMEGR